MLGLLENFKSSQNSRFREMLGWRGDQEKLHFSLMFFCHRLPGLRWICRYLPLQWFFQWTRLSVLVSLWLYPHRRRSVRPLLRALHGHIDSGRARDLAKRYLVYRQWFNNLVYAWPNCWARCDEWVSLEGENYLREVLAENNGAILLGGHLFGYERYVAPALAQRGYKINRVGAGEPALRMARWGKGPFKVWRYFDYRGDYWQRIQVIHELGQVLRRNEIILMPIMASPTGASDLEIDFFYKRFFLDAVTVRLIETLKAAVLPCFAICDDSGRLQIKFYAPLAPTRPALMRGFAPLYSRYLGEYPEFARIWKRILEQRCDW